MNFFAFRNRLRHSWLALGRHGTHSPFVYDLVDFLLKENDFSSQEGKVSNAQLLESRLLQYFKLEMKEKYSASTWKSIEAENLNLSQFDILLDTASESSIFFITGIYENAKANSNWISLTNTHQVRMALDFYDGGLLLFRKHFKKKQCFKLKWH